MATSSDLVWIWGDVEAQIMIEGRSSYMRGLSFHLERTVNALPRGGVIASEAKQSVQDERERCFLTSTWIDCFVAALLAMTYPCHSEAFLAEGYSPRHAGKSGSRPNVSHPSRYGLFKGTAQASLDKRARDDTEACLPATRPKDLHHRGWTNISPAPEPPWWTDCFVAALLAMTQDRNADYRQSEQGVDQRSNA